LKDLERGISNVLRAGVLASIGFILLGMVLIFVHDPSYLSSTGDLERLTHPGAAIPRYLREVLSGVASLDGQATVAFGLLILIATPVARVAVSIAGFVAQRDRTYIVITSAVLLLLLLAFVLGGVAG
jgi:uncharacterized membrane protein